MRASVFKSFYLSAAVAIFLAACSESTNTTEANGEGETSAISSSSVDDGENIGSSEVAPVDSTNGGAGPDSSSEKDATETSSSGDVSVQSSSSCGDTVAEQSSASFDEEPASSASTANPESSSDVAMPESSESIAVPESSESIEEESSSSEAVATLSAQCLEMRSTQDKFIPLEEVFDCVLPKEKLVFVIRHGERDKNATGTTGDLNKNGKSQSRYLGGKIALKTQEDFYYVSTKSYRTLNTNVYISKGKGETFLDSTTVFSKDTSFHYKRSEDFTDSWFVKESTDKCDGVGSWARFTKFAYEPSACPDKFYNVDEKSKEIIDKHFMYKDIPNVTVVSSHDNFIAPFLISLTDRKIGLEAHEYVFPNHQYNEWNQNIFKHWPNYLAGVAIIVNENDERAFVPVKGLNTGYLGQHCLTGKEDGYDCSMWEKDVK
ncbi:MAG: hypothetical protein HUK19_00620 [Fibrobacter sp.]|nr:hypothetical protein [Fibrobacter sp.]